MSYCSINLLPEGTHITKVIRLIEQLGYYKYRKTIPHFIAEYGWYVNDTEHISFVGIELNIYRNEDAGNLQVETRTRVGRSFWDLNQQNKTIKFIRDYIGGTFVTDEGVNRLMCNDTTEPSKIASALYLIRWHYNSSSIKPLRYLWGRDDKDDTQISGLSWLDSSNPRLFSNNLLLTYYLAIWEDYLKSSFMMILRHTDSGTKVYKSANLTAEEIKAVALQKITIEQIISDKLSFQRPGTVSENFKMIDDKIDLYTVLRKPYRKRKITLYDSIDELVDIRNACVHNGYIETSITDKKLQVISDDVTEAVNRIYNRFAEYYKFIPRYDF